MKLFKEQKINWKPPREQLELECTQETGHNHIAGWAQCKYQFLQKLKPNGMVEYLCHERIPDLCAGRGTFSAQHNHILLRSQVH
jgi:hypothetical protein